MTTYTGKTFSIVSKSTIPSHISDFLSGNSYTGKTFSIVSKSTIPSRILVDASRSYFPLIENWDTWLLVEPECTFDTVEIADYPTLEVKLTYSIVQPDYGTLPSLAKDITIVGSQTYFWAWSDNNNKVIKCGLYGGTTYINGMYVGFQWKWDGTIPDFVDEGFFKLVFDYDVYNINGTYFIFELSDSDGNIVWSKSGTTSGTNETVTFPSLGWTFQIRCFQNGYTSPDPITAYARISNIKIYEYYDVGTITSKVHYNTYVDRYEKVYFSADNSQTGAKIYLKFRFSDDNITWTDWLGYDSQPNPLYPEDPGTYFLPNTWTRWTAQPPYKKYYQWRIDLWSLRQDPSVPGIYYIHDGRGTPIFYGIHDLKMYVGMYKVIIPIMKTRSPFIYFPDGTATANMINKASTFTTNQPTDLKKVGIVNIGGTDYYFPIYEHYI